MLSLSGNARIVFVLVSLVPAASRANTPEPPQGAPGCEYIQRQVKKCSVSPVGGLGTFDVIIAPPASLVVTFQEPLVGMTPPPPSSYRATFSGATATVVPIRRDPLPGSTVHFDTASLHVTLNLVPGPTPDTQLLIADPRLTGHAHESEHRSDAAEGLEDHGAQHVDEVLVREIATGGVETVDLAAQTTRHNQIVLRAERIIRIGSRRVLVFSIDNRSGDTLEVSAVRIWKGPERSDRELPHPVFRGGADEILPNALVSVGVALPSFTAAPSDRLRILVEFTDGDHNLELSGIHIR